MQRDFFWKGGWELGKGVLGSASVGVRALRSRKGYNFFEHVDQLVVRKLKPITLFFEAAYL